MNPHELINYEPEFDLSNPYIVIEKEIIGMLNERDDAIDNEHVEEVVNMQIGDVVVDRVGVESALVKCF
jgi:hypothetical protein